jgi:hypothetical protein
MSTLRLTRDEQLIAEDFTRVLDYLSRVMQGLERGNWHYTREKTDALARAADQLFARLSEGPRRGPLSGDDAPVWPRLAPVHADPERLRAAICEYARHYAAGRALYPPR